MQACNISEVLIISFGPHGSNMLLPDIVAAAVQESDVFFSRRSSTAEECQKLEKTTAAHSLPEV